jgi:hypothetical protein
VFGTRRFLDDVGLFATDRFLYNEEHDWANRARKAGFRLGWAPQAEVRNIQATTLESVQHEDRLVLTRYLGARARVRYGMVHDRLFVPVLAGAQIGRATLDVLHGHRRAARSGVRGLLDGFTGRHRSFEQLGPAVYPGVVRS